MIKVAAVQMGMGKERSENVQKAKKLTQEAIAQGAKIVLLPELFEGEYFCKDMDEKYFAWARERKNHPVIAEFAEMAKKSDVVILVSYFEKENGKYYNSLVMVDGRGEHPKQYRKTHIPDGPGYEEKFYFTPGDTGFVVWETKYGNVGAGICWDQWFCESARILTLKGADIIFYPTAIGSEPEIGIDSKEHWQRVQMGHAATNTVPVVAANRIGVEEGRSCTLTFYGSSFMTDYTGAKIAEASRDKEEILYGEYDFAYNARQRQYWGLLRDRREEMYRTICKK